LLHRDEWTAVVLVRGLVVVGERPFCRAGHVKRGGDGGIGETEAERHAHHCCCCLVGLLLNGELKIDSEFNQLWIQSIEQTFVRANQFGSFGCVRFTQASWNL
jgi:hypothetical protein